MDTRVTRSASRSTWRIVALCHRPVLSCMSSYSRLAHGMSHVVRSKAVRSVRSGERGEAEGRGDHTCLVWPDLLVGQGRKGAIWYVVYYMCRALAAERKDCSRD